MEAMDIDAKVVGCHTLSMKRVDAANAAEEMPCRLGMKLVLGERRFSGKEPELALVHLDHQRVLAPADGAVAHRQLRKIGVDLEPDGAAMAGTLVGAHGRVVMARQVGERGGKNRIPRSADGWPLSAFDVHLARLSGEGHGVCRGSTPMHRTQLCEVQRLATSEPRIESYAYFFAYAGEAPEHARLGQDRGAASSP